MSSAFAFPTGSVSNVGRVREVNEDAVVTMPDIGMWAVADGMGGYGRGDVASQAVVKALGGLAACETASGLLADFERPEAARGA